MRRYILDTGVAADLIYRRGSAFKTAQERAQQGASIGVAMPTVGELFAGVEYSKTREANLKIVVRNLTKLTHWPFDRAAAEEFGRIFAYLRRTGHPIQQIDMQIAAVALTLGNCTLVTKDIDFRAIPELTIETWT